MGFQKPSRIQEHAFPLLLRDGPDGRCVRADRRARASPGASLIWHGARRGAWGCRPRNLIAQSQAGTGKTAAFAVCMLGRTDPSIPAVQALCIAPTRELARQIGDVVKQMGKFTPVTVYMAVKDSAGPGTASSSRAPGGSVCSQG